MNPPLIHRDIKPSNIMLSKDGGLYLIDFNASKELHNNKTEDTVLYGTQYFSAPEQLTGYGASSPATDVFALGATIYYLMTGMNISPKTVSYVGFLQDVIAKSTEMNQKDRYQSIDEFEKAFLAAYN